MGFMPKSFIGHPVGWGWTVTRGIVSAVRRPGEVRGTAMIQTDAAISPGNSGGTLLDCHGRLLGIVVATLAGRGIAEPTSLPVRLSGATPTNLMKAASGGLRDHSTGPTPP